MKKWILFVTSLLLISTNLVFAQEVIPDFSPESVTVLNEELRKLRNSKPVNTTYTIAYSRDMTAAAGDVSYTGCPFAPKGVIIMAITTGTSSIGMASEASGYGGDNNEIFQGVYSNAGTTTWSGGGTRIISFQTTPSVFQNGFIKSFDSDGVTITWFKGGSPTGTLSFGITYFK